MRTLTLIRKTVSPADPPVTLRVVTHSGAGDLLPFGEERALPIREQGEEVSFFLPDGKAPGGDSKIAIPAGRDSVALYVWVIATAEGELDCITLPCPPPKEAKAPSGQGAAQNGPLGRMVSDLSGQESPSEPGDSPAQGEFSGPVPPMPQGPGELARYRLGGEGWVDLRQHQSGRRGEQLYNLATGTASLVLTMLTRPESSPQKEMRNRGCHTLAVKMVFHFEDMDLLYYFDGSQEPGDSWRRYYRNMVCGPREEPLFLDGWEMKWVENAAHTHLVKLLEEQGLLEKAWMEEGRVGLRP